MKAAIALILLVFCVGATASEAIYLGGWSNHVGFDRNGINETHDLIAYERDGVIVGTFINSFSDRSYAALLNVGEVSAGGFRARALAGVVYGYRECNSVRQRHMDPKRYCPAIVPEISYTRYRVEPSLILLGPVPALTFRLTF